LRFGAVSRIAPEIALVNIGTPEDLESYSKAA
jgi:hypothetical protein